MDMLKNMQQRLAEDQTDLLKRVWAPVVTGTPLEDSRRSVCILPDGEIRAYGHLGADLITKEKGIEAYLSSTDCGLSWQPRYAGGAMHSCTYIPEADLYLAIADSPEKAECYDDKNALYVLRSGIGPDDPAPEAVKVCDATYFCSLLPVKSAFCDRIWFSAQKRDSDCTAGFFYSDDFGATWHTREIATPKGFETVFPHKGLRWCVGSGTEPCTVELGKNELMMLIRSSTDCFWKAYSHDGGETWTEPEPSTFYGTDTTAFLLRLHDGRIVAFWNNTKPLSQPNFSARGTCAEEGVKNGRGENAFTNRDAAHAAISEDGGKTWIGYREILLNDIRNNADFRYCTPARSTRDKSVHQFQAHELPYNKVLVSVGQNAASARLVIFDVGWLYETSRDEEFLFGMRNITAHTFLKSVSGCYFDAVGNGHCAWNRTYSAYPAPDPEDFRREVMSVSKRHDDRLINDIGGIVWNFPMSGKGRVSVRLMILEKQARFVLTDRWYNVCDPYAAMLSPFWFELDADDLGDGYTDVTVDYDVEQGGASVSLDGRHFFDVQMRTPCATGISYLMLQCAADGDSRGFYIKSMHKE